MADEPRKKQKYHKSLASLLRFFEGEELGVEIKTGRLYRGILSSSDDAMNVTLDDVKIQEPHHYKTHHQEQQQPPTTTWTTAHIRGSTIRYIHFPDHLDLSATIKQGVDRERTAAQKYKRGIRKKAG